MPSAQEYLTFIENTTRDASDHVDPRTQWWINQLREIIENEIPEYTNIHMNTVYQFKGKRNLMCRGVVTKENDKTWVIYETTDSSRPGTRWMISKNWCTKDNIRRDENQSYAFPVGIKIK